MLTEANACVLGSEDGECGDDDHLYSWGALTLCYQVGIIVSGKVSRAFIDFYGHNVEDHRDLLRTETCLERWDMYLPLHNNFLRRPLYSGVLQSLFTLLECMYVLYAVHYTKS